VPRDLEVTNELWPETLGRLVSHIELPEELVGAALTAILKGEATDAQIAGFALGLRAKGETPAELAALVRTMLHFAERVEVSAPVLVDTCGTGGDRSGTVNVSTMAALVVAGAGIPVAKHGNRAASSQCGSADVLEALGVAIDLGPEGVARCINEAGIGFCFAQRFHSGMRYAAGPRRELGIATTFNVLGPLANPAGATHRTIGVSDPAMAERVTRTLAELGIRRALVFYGHDGLDELTTTTTSTVHELADGAITTYEVDPSAWGLSSADRHALAGGDAARNARAVHRVLGGEAGPLRELVALNAAAAFLVCDRVADLGEGLELAFTSIDEGSAAATLDAFIRVSVAARAGEAA
jgi:anthranilate phosphoribosyltransferase